MPQTDLPPLLHWQVASDVAEPPTAAQQFWLLDEQSLTQRLTQLSNERFSVMPINQGWQPLRSDECAALHISNGSEGWVREVYLRGTGQPWVFARSVAARSALSEAGVDLTALGSRSLGELLFSEWAFHRGPIELCRYPAAALPKAVRCDGLWARRSCFSRDALGVLVAEVFLPAFWQASGRQP